MANEKPATVKVRALQAHSYNGKDYAPGATYDLAADLVDSLQAQGKAQLASVPVPPAPKPSKPVEPMGTDAFGVKAKAGKPLPALKKPAGKKR